MRAEPLQDRGESAGAPEPPSRVALPGLLRALRPVQWLKNALLFVPLLLVHRAGETELLLRAVFAAALFCTAASAGYLLNDLLDAPADRQHPRKRGRPLASGEVSPVAAGCLAAALGALALGLGVLLGAAFAGMVALYLGLAGAYSALLKRIAVADVLVLAGLYIHRVLAGGVATGVPVSPWLLVFCLFFFTSLALAKRSVELRGIRERELARIPGRGYRSGDLALLETAGVASGYLAVLVIGLYVNFDTARNLYRAPELLWGICPVMLFWVTRVWLLVRRQALHDDPLVFAVRDPASYLAGALVVGVAWLASAGLPGPFAGGLPGAD